MRLRLSMICRVLKVVAGGGRGACCAAVWRCLGKTREWLEGSLSFEAWATIEAAAVCVVPRDLSLHVLWWCLLGSSGYCLLD